MRYKIIDKSLVFNFLVLLDCLYSKFRLNRVSYEQITNSFAGPKNP